MEEKAASFRLALAVLLAAFLIRVFFLQVVFGSHYRVLAARNQYQIFHRQAPRGLILDAMGVPLAANVSAFNLYFNPHVSADGIQEHAARVAQAVEISVEEIRKGMREAKARNKTTLIASQLRREQAVRFFEVSRQFPEFFLDYESLRHYPMKEIFSHVLGYLNRIQSREEYRKLANQGYRFDSWVGRFGLEKAFENQLRGLDGAVLLEVDAVGRPVRAESGASQPLTIDAFPGNDVVLTARASLLKEAYDALKASKSGVGSAVVLDPRSGAVLALVSTPGFDPNNYVRIGVSPSAGRGEFPRALTGTYPPGSVFKIVSGLAVLEAGLDPKRKFNCNGSYALPTRVFKCWKKEGHGAVDFVEGLKHSCDVYFYNAGLFAGGAKISEQAQNFLLGTAVSIEELPYGGASGFVPTPSWKEKKKGDIWRPGDTLNLSIGQGEVLATPVQLAVLTSLAANRGHVNKPYLVQEVRDPLSGRMLYRHSLRPQEALLRRVEGVSESSWKFLEEGLRAVVEGGTAQGMRMPGVAIFGKTGTAQNPLGDDHALFVCYVKDINGVPRLAVAVVVENGGHGSSAAVPVARRIVAKFIESEPGEFITQDGAPVKG